MTEREAAKAEYLATRRVDCPECGTETWWPNGTSAKEITCDCNAILRLEPDGRVRRIAWLERASAPEEEYSDPDDLAGL